MSQIGPGGTVQINMPGPGGGGRGFGGGPGNRFANTAKPKDARGTLLRLWRYYITQKKKLLVVVALCVLDTLLMLIVPYVLGKAVEIITENAGHIAFGAVGIAVLALAGMYVVNWLGTFGQGWISAGATQRIVRLLRQDLFDKLQRMSTNYFDTHAKGDIMSRLTNDIDNISATISQATVQLVTAVLTVVGALIMMLLISPLLTLAALVSAPLVVGLTRIIVKHTGPLFSRQQRTLGQLNGIIQETISDLRTVRAFNREQSIVEEFAAQNEALRDVAVKAQIWSGYLMPMMNVISNLSYGLIAWCGGLMALNGLVSIGGITSFLSYTRQFTRPLNGIAGIYNTLQSAIAGAERVFQIMDEADEPTDSPEAIDLGVPKGEVVFQHVDFAYVPGKQILKDVSFYVKPGEKIALVGPTGAGKTTIVNLLTRFYEIEKGRILIDGRDIREYTRDSLRHAFSVVLQDTCLFSGTIADNISYARPDASRSEVVSAAVASGADSFIRRLPQGYDTPISGGNDSLSQGQRQLLAIARAMLSGAPIIILDEATSSVDTRTEVHIQRAMLKLSQGRTSFIIAHRLNTIRNADRIMVVQDGGIAEMGTHGELIAARGLYYRMYMSQLGENMVETDRDDRLSSVSV